MYESLGSLYISSGVDGVEVILGGVESVGAEDAKCLAVGWPLVRESPNLQWPSDHHVLHSVLAPGDARWATRELTR